MAYTGVAFRIDVVVKHLSHDAFVADVNDRSFPWHAHTFSTGQTHREVGTKVSGLKGLQKKGL